MQIKRLLMVVATAVFLLGASQFAHADFVMYLNDLGTAGIDVIVADNAPVGTPTAAGLTTVADGNPLLGMLTYTGGAGVFTANVSTGTSKPLIGPSKLDLNSVDVSGGAGVLQIFLTDTDFVSIGGDYILTNIWGGTTNGSVRAQGALDINNQEFGASYLLPIQGPFGPGGFTDTISGDAGMVPAGFFSLTEAVEITHTAAGQITSFDKELVAAIPEPTSLLLLGTGLLGIVGFARFRRH